ncbi:DJ-1/PfpI family protein [Demequina capsici]|uniref:DJ-1/PfpI family protein n=1 Tax=Demequina capsici TaxID=3075620 RepID=A0AA96J8I1_9MICO|nr:DJ-1/PfpI family protein [Demequina sp. OYTSA14]WNM25485.1 DJ-1/PfpI family protein [Demequina sp. OYTSA14]
MSDGATTIVMVLVPQVTQLDLTGPAQVFARWPGAHLVIAAARAEPVMTDCGFAIVPTATFDTAPQADYLIVPGGEGVFDVLSDRRTVDFVRVQARGARVVGSVCTGAFLLGVAGLLDGVRATTHWGSMRLLPLVGAVPTPSRVVRDGRVVTGGGVTSGIDMALALAADALGEQVAREIQLAIEYDPEPPFDAGSPDAFPEAEIELRRRAIEDRRRARVEAGMRASA